MSRRGEKLKSEDHQAEDRSLALNPVLKQIVMLQQVAYYKNILVSVYLNNLFSLTLPEKCHMDAVRVKKLCAPEDWFVPGIYVVAWM